MKWWMAGLLPLALAACAGPDRMRVSGGVTISQQALADMSGPHYYAMSCNAGDISGCERAAARVCPGGTRVIENHVRNGKAGGRRLPVRDMVFTCR